MIKKDILESLNAWHSDEVRGNKVYFADVVEEVLENIELQIQKLRDKFESKDNVLYPCWKAHEFIDEVFGSQSIVKTKEEALS